MGWMLVVFDLPVQEPLQRKRATLFRQYLLEQGYRMIQYSVYARACVSYNRMQTQMRRLKQNIPHEGHVRAVYITQAQWDKMYIAHGAPSKPTENIPEPFPEQLLLW